MPVVLFGGKVVPSYSAMPGRITPVVVLHDHGWVFDDLAALEVLVVIEMHPHQLGRVEQPVVVVRQVGYVMTCQVADVLTGRVGVLRAEDTEAAVVGERQRDHTDAREAAPFRGGLVNHGQPRL